MLHTSLEYPSHHRESNAAGFAQTTPQVNPTRDYRANPQGHFRTRPTKPPELVFEASPGEPPGKPGFARVLAKRDPRSLAFYLTSCEGSTSRAAAILRMLSGNAPPRPFFEFADYVAV